MSPRYKSIKRHLDEEEEPSGSHSSDAFLTDERSASLRNLEEDLHKYKTRSFYLGYLCIILTLLSFILVGQHFKSEQDLQKRCFALHSTPCKTIHCVAKL